MFSNAITLHVFTIARHSPEYYEEWVADLVGEPFERIPGPVGAQFCCRHNGVSLGLRENMVATALAHDAGTVSLSEYIAGQVHDAGWELVPRARIDQYLELSEAILAVAGAELEGEGKERAWTKLEEALQVAFGTWQVMALERITALRAFPEGPHRLS
jgi:transcriptional antiterminator Rof (Rho-off)